MSKARRFRELLAKPGPIVAPGVYDCISAKLVERVGFPAAFISGAAVTASILGYPDIGLQTMPEILNQAQNIARAVEIPVIADVDTGYGNALNVMRTVREFEAAGVAGIFIEDQTFPKRCGHFEGKQVTSTEEMVVKIKAACEARRDKDFVIIARTDARALYGLDHAIARGIRYAEAGADIIFIEALLSVEELAKVARSIPKPPQANLNEGSKTRSCRSESFTKWALSSLPTASLYPEHLCDLVERSELLGLEDFYRLEERLYGPLLETEGSWRKELAARKSSRCHRPLPL